jgi:hypothetical protein
MYGRVQGWIPDGLALDTSCNTPWPECVTMEEPVVLYTIHMGAVGAIQTIHMTSMVDDEDGNLQDLWTLCAVLGATWDKFNFVIAPVIMEVLRVHTIAVVASRTDDGLPYTEIDLIGNQPVSQLLLEHLPTEGHA